MNKQNIIRLTVIVYLITRTVSPAEGRVIEPLTTTMTFAGSGTNLPIIRLLANAFKSKHPGVHITVPASIGSTSGIRAAADRAITIGLISRPLKENETKLGLDIITYAHTPLIIGVHPSVTEDSITSAELVDIYRGKKTNWANGKEIIVLTREPGDSTIEVLVKSVTGFAEAYRTSQKEKRWTTLLKDLEMNESLANTPNAIGFSDLGAIVTEKHRIKPLKINGVEPTIRNTKNGSYPFVKPLMFVFLKDSKLPPAARDFLDFVRSKEGKKILRLNGYLPEK